MMTNGIRNIEKFFQDLFGNFRVKPYRDSWDKIADALDTTNPKDAIIPDIAEVGTLFKGFKVTPSEGVWQNITRILERDNLPLQRFSRSAVTAIVAFFSHTAITVVTSVVILGGLALLLFNQFNGDAPKLAVTDHAKQIKETSRNPVSQYSTQNQITKQKQIIASQEQNSQLANNQKTQQSDLANNEFNTIPNKQNQTVLKNNKATTQSVPINNQIIINNQSTSQNSLILNNTEQSTSIVTNQIIPDNKTTILRDNLLNKYPSVKFRISQNRFKFDNAHSLSVDLHKKWNETTDYLYNKWAKKYKRKRDLFSVEAYYLPVYGSTTYIAHQINSATLERSFNEYLNGNNSCIGMNFGYNPNRFSIETGIMYHDLYTRRNDDLKWISYHDSITKDSIGFIFNTIDSIYHTIYNIDTLNKRNELLKSYRTQMSYHTIEVPLLIGYKLMYKKNTLTVRTGILASFIVKSTEDITNIDESARPYIIYPDKNKVEFSYVLNLSYDFNINDNFKISVTPTFRYNITGLYKGYSINSRPVTGGLGLGVKYLF